MKTVKEIKIRKDVPLPARGLSAKRGLEMRFPLHKLKVGESFVIPYNSKTDLRKVQNSIGYFRSLVDKTKKFALRSCKVKKEIGVWRIK